MFKAGDRVREIKTGDIGTVVRFRIDPNADDDDEQIPGYYVSWDCYNGSQLWIEADAIEAVEDAS